jgi:hypothetical protein
MAAKSDLWQQNRNIDTLAALHQQGARIIHLAAPTQPIVWEIEAWYGRLERPWISDGYRIRGRALTRGEGALREFHDDTLGGAYPWRAGWPEQEDDPNGR